MVVGMIPVRGVLSYVLIPLFHDVSLLCSLDEGIWDVGGGVCGRGFESGGVCGVDCGRNVGPEGMDSW